MIQSLDSERTRLTYFEEVQYLRQVWFVKLACLGCIIYAGGILWALYQEVIIGRQVTDGQLSPEALSIVGVGCLILVGGLVWFLYELRLMVRVEPDVLFIHFFPLKKKEIPIGEISSIEACSYRPILHYGGWGIRYGGKRGWCYNVKGNRGVRLELTGGKRFLIGSQEPEALADALQQASLTYR
jgi:hypothetical protein